MSKKTHFTEVLTHDADLIVRFEHERGAVVRYTVILRHIDATGRARTVRVFDNAHGVEDPQGEHHAHRYTPEGVKQMGESFHDGSAGEALRAAIAIVREGFQEMIQPWQ